MSQIPNENDDNHSVAASVVKLEPPDEVPDQQKRQGQQEGQSQFGLNQSFDSSLDTGSTHNNNYENELEKQKLIIKTLEANIQTLQEKMENLELKAKIRALEENKEQNTKYEALEAKMNEVVQMLSTQKEEHHKEMAQLKDGFTKEMAQLKNVFAKEMAQLESKNRNLEEKLVSNVEVQITKNRALDAKMEQLQGEFSKMLMLAEPQKLAAEQQQQMMAQFQAQFHSLKQKLNEAEQRAQMGKNELEEIIQQKMEKFREEMGQNGQQAIDSNLSKLDYMWSHLMVKSKILANPKGFIWDGLKMKARISECGLKATANIDFVWVFAIATEGYAISGEHCRKENFPFPGTIVFYYEVTITSSINYSSVGFTGGSKPVIRRVGVSPDSYGIEGCDAKSYSLWLSEKEHKLEYPTEAISRVKVNVLGCGLLLNSKNELAVFFTRNGVLLGKQTPINPTVDRLYPTVYIYHASVEANFGDNLVAKPFKFDTNECPGLVFE